MLLNLQTELDTSIRSRIPLDRVAVIILGGGKGTRLEPLTLTRCKPAISFGGRYTLIDVPISHSLTSGLSKIFVIGQYLAYSLQKHLFQTYLYHGVSQDQIQFLVPEERAGEKVWFNGTADAVRKNLPYFDQVSADYFLILSGDQLYNINFQHMINFALDTDADMVVASQPVNKKDATRMGLLKTQHGGSKIIDFHEKPKEDVILDSFDTDPETLHAMGYDGNNGRSYLGSMGIYLFKRQAMFDLLKEDTREDFGMHLITTQMKKGKTHAYLYDGYWEDIGTIDSYFRANLALTRPDPNGLNLYDEGSQIITKRYSLPGMQITGGDIKEALICEGSIIEAKEVRHSVIGVRSLIGRNTTVRDSIIIGNDAYEINGKRPGIGTDCHLERAILDENVTLGNGVTLVNQKGHENFTSPDGKVVVKDGIMIIPRGTVIPDNYVF